MKIKNHKPLVTIIITCFNYGNFLDGAIKSALSQTYQNIEIIVIDDGSTDNTSEVVKKFTKTIRYFKQSNLGISSARNNGVKLSRGEYICFLDADDLLLPEFVGRLEVLLTANEYASFAYCDMKYFGTARGFLRGKNFSIFLLTGNNYIGTNALIRKEDFLKVGGFDEKLTNITHEDWDFWLKMAECGNKGVYFPQALYKWKRHKLGSRNPKHGKKLNEDLKFIATRHQRLISKKSWLMDRLFFKLNKYFKITNHRKLLELIDKLVFGI